MRHARRRGRLGLVQEHRKALLRNLARSLIIHQQIVTTHARAKEAGRFVDRLVTIAKEGTLHARRNLIRKLGAGSESFAKRLIDTIAPKLNGRRGGYTRVLRYKDRPGDGASMALLEFSIPVVEVEEKKPKKKKKEPKPEMKEVKEKARDKKREEAEKTKAAPPKEEAGKADLKKETPKKGGFLSSLRRFLKGEDDKK